MPTLQPYPYEKPLQEAPEAPPAPPREPNFAALLAGLLNLLRRIPGISKSDSYLYDERGITAANPQLDIDVIERLGRPGTSGFISSDSTTIKVIINTKGNPVTLFITEKLTISNTDGFSISRLFISSTSPTASVRIFLT